LTWLCLSGGGPSLLCVSLLSLAKIS
jgi:hypothetical protein